MRKVACTRNSLNPGAYMYLPQEALVRLLHLNSWIYIFFLHIKHAVSSQHILYFTYSFTSMKRCGATKLSKSSETQCISNINFYFKTNVCFNKTHRFYLMNTCFNSSSPYRTIYCRHNDI